MAGVLSLSGAGTGAGFIPAQLPSLELWYEGRFIASPPDDSDPLTTWTEKGGRDATGSGGTRPLYYDTTSARLINGEPAVTFDGTDDTMAAADFAYTSYNTGLYVYAMWRPANAGDVTSNIFAQWTPTGNQRAFQITKNATTDVLGFAVSSDGTIGAGQFTSMASTETVTDGTPSLVELHHDFTAGTHEMLLDGTALTLSGTDNSLTSIHNSTGSFSIGADGDGNNVGSGDIAAIVFGTANLSDDEKVGMRSYFRNIYGANV